MSRISSSARGSSQRSGAASASGRKSRSATSTSHKGSRVEPSHITDQKRSTRVKKADKASKKPSKK